MILAGFSTMGITCGKTFLPLDVSRETFYMCFIQAAASVAIVAECFT